MLQDFKPVLIILARFLIIYLVFLAGYQFYLHFYEGTGLDPVSKWVASQSAMVQNALDYKTFLADQPKYETTWFNVNNKWVSMMVEGCNAVSVMILFLAFVFAFYKGKKTFVFAGLSLVFLHVMNVLRIAGLNILALELPKYTKIGHDYFFPAIIYGSVVLLWLIWIKFFALKDENN
ncbi:MAG: exosortase family protein XrtF [Bergeyella sp.]